MAIFPLALISPDQFQTVALAWIGSAVAVVIALGYGIAKVAPIISQVKTLFVLHDKNAARIDTTQASLTNVALSVSPNSNSNSGPLVVRETVVSPSDEAGRMP